MKLETVDLLRFKMQVVSVRAEMERLALPVSTIRPLNDLLEKTLPTLERRREANE